MTEVNSENISMFLREVSQEHKDEYIIMCMDQAGWHKAKGLNVPGNMRLYWIPAYSPDSNPVENIWEEVREKWFNNKVFDSLDAVEDTFVEALSTLGKDKKRVKGLADFNWIVSICMKAN